jgi:hypothetical protein
VAPTRVLPRPAARKIVRLPPPGRCRRARACQPGECLFSLPRSARHISPVRHDCCRQLPMGWTTARTLPPICADTGRCRTVSLVAQIWVICALPPWQLQLGPAGRVLSGVITTSVYGDALLEVTRNGA